MLTLLRARVSFLGLLPLILSVTEGLFWVAVACCVAAQVAIVRSAIRARSRAAGDGIEVPRPKRVIEIAWTLLPALALALVLVLTWRAIHAPSGSAPAPQRVDHSLQGNGS
jgi:heme/copper-type cytochrome/quinol oxidase subunit 2